MNVAAQGMTGPLTSSSRQFAAPIPISTKPQLDPEVRRAGRLLSMVHELHKAGYQHLRICAGIGIEGNWRCLITSADNVGKDGWTPITTNGSHVYSTADEARYFDWNDAAGNDARVLATKFVERFPDTARAAVGEDWTYAGWFTLLLGYAENGILPAFFAHTGSIPSKYVSVAPPRMPECVDVRVEKTGTGQQMIWNDELRLAHLPPLGADYDQLWPFCLSFDGYCMELRTGEDCSAIADRVERAGLEKATLEELRATAFYRQRQIKWSDCWLPNSEWIRSIQNVIEEIRRRLAQNTGTEME